VDVIGEVQRFQIAVAHTDDRQGTQLPGHLAGLMALGDLHVRGKQQRSGLLVPTAGERAQPAADLLDRRAALLGADTD
jgi:hypothetical protein